MNSSRWARFAGVLLLLAAVYAGAAGLARPALADNGQHDGSYDLFVRSARENADATEVTLPLFRGTSQGRTVWYVILDSSRRADAAVRGVNYVPKLENAHGTAAVQTVHIVNGLVDFPASVDFSPQHILVPGPTGFPPAAAAPGAVGEDGYSPLIALPDGTILDAPQIANATGQADKVVTLDTDHQQVVYRETEGRYDNRVVHYVSFDASIDVAAAIEDVTYAPLLAAAPALGDESHASAREGLIAFINGQTGASNPQRQGLNSALLDHLPPLNILHEVPEGQSDPGFPAYSPLWDVRFAAWTPVAIAAGLNTRQADFGTVLSLVQQGWVTGPGGAPFGPVGIVVTCPLISMEPSH